MWGVGEGGGGESGKGIGEDGKRRDDAAGLRKHVHLFKQDLRRSRADCISWVAVCVALFMSLCNDAISYSRTGWCTQHQRLQTAPPQDV